jgi:capsule polysaccharide export protein KpsE/RkpR
MLAALAGRAAGGLGSLGGLAGSLLGGHNTSALFVDLLRSGTVSGHLIDRYNLQQAYGKRYRVDAAKYLAHHTTIVDDKKSGVITITVEDADPYRARDLAAAYLDELNHIVTSTSTSSARQERLFIERRLAAVQTDLEQAQLELSDFSSIHATLDIKEQTHAMVDSAAKLQGMLIAAQSELGSLEQIYGDGNVRVRAAQARVASLQRELSRMSGTDAPLPSGTTQAVAKDELYPPLRQLPRLAVPYANLYRRVRIQETVYELLTQEYEAARIEEAKDTPVVNVIDAPGVPEKKSFPPRLIVALLLTLATAIAAAAHVLLRQRWQQMKQDDPRKLLLLTIAHRLYPNPATLDDTPAVEV